MNMFDCFAAIGESWAQACYETHMALFRTLAAITPTATKYNQVKPEKVFNFALDNDTPIADQMSEKIDQHG